ncbi:unnamed protein product [Merluccius merluccius]
MKVDHREESHARKTQANDFQHCGNTEFHHSLKSVCDMGSWCWQGFPQEGMLLTPMGLLRRFLLLKQLTVLLSPHGAALPLLVGCVFSMKALVLLRSPHISTKPSSVFLGQLALAGLLPLPYLVLRLASWMTLGLAMMTREAPGTWVWWWSGAIPRVLAERLLDAHLLASLLLLGLLGLEGLLVSRWPLQTRRLRTAQYAQLSCCLVWLLVLMELLLLVVVDVGWMAGARPDTETDGVSVSAALALPNSSVYLRRALWLGNVWFHYFHVIYRRPKRRASCFH